MKYSRWFLAAATLVASASATPLTVAAEPRDKIDATVRHLVDQTGAESISVLITRRSRSSAVLNTLRAHNADIKSELQVGNIVAARVPAQDLDAIAQDPDVVRVAYDAPMQTQSSQDPLSQPALQTVFPIAVQADQAWNSDARLRGTGVGIAVIDSGVDGSDADFLNGSLSGSSSQTRLIVQQGMIKLTPGLTTDDNGHGTWVAGIAGGRGWGSAPSGASGQYIGIAPDANLIALKTSDSTGAARTSDVISALQWVFNNQAQYNIRVVNISSVASVAESYTTSALDAAVEMAWLKGIVVVVSSGNGGPNTLQYSPANDPYVITVGATDDMGTADPSDDRLAAFSSYGTTQDGFSKPDVVAPGRHIAGTLASGSPTLLSQFPTRVVGNGQYISLSGTSASAPIVSGAVADILQARSTYRPNDIKSLLMSTALPIPGAGTGAGYPQIMRAVSADAISRRVNVGLVPNNYVAAAGCKTLPTGTNCSQANWSAVSWDSVSWNSVSWDSVSWDSVSWNSVSWNSVSWNNVTGT